MSAPTIEKIAGGIATLARAIGRPVRLMEVCGTHTVAIFRHGIRALLPESIQLFHAAGMGLLAGGMALFYRGKPASDEA